MLFKLAGKLYRCRLCGALRLTAGSRRKTKSSSKRDPFSDPVNTAVFKLNASSGTSAKKGVAAWSPLDKKNKIKK